MGEVTITINGRNYGIFCDDGQEQRVMDLSHHVDSKIRDISEIGAANNESHLLVLTAIMLADEAFDLRDNISVMGDEITETTASEDEQIVAETIDHLADRINLVAERIVEKA